MRVGIIPALIALGVGHAVLPSQVQNTQWLLERSRPVGARVVYRDRGTSSRKRNGGRPMFKQNRRAQMRASK